MVMSEGGVRASLGRSGRGDRSLITKMGRRQSAVAFFGYLPWSSQLQAATYQSFSSTYNQLVAADMRHNEHSGTGQTLAHLLSH